MLSTSAQGAAHWSPRTYTDQGHTCNQHLARAIVMDCLPKSRSLSGSLRRTHDTEGTGRDKREQESEEQSILPRGGASALASAMTCYSRSMECRLEQPQDTMYRRRSVSTTAVLGSSRAPGRGPNGGPPDGRRHLRWLPHMLLRPWLQWRITDHSPHTIPIVMRVSRRKCQGAACTLESRTPQRGCRHWSRTHQASDGTLGQVV